MKSSAFICLLTAHCSQAYAFSSFQTNCTLPDERVSYVSSPNVRGSLDLVWSSITTLIACTYTCLHLNVPKQYYEPPSNWRERVRRLSFWTGLFWSCVTLVVPEIVIGKALADLIDSKAQLDQLHKSKPETKATWTLTHFLYANMGGFVLSSDDTKSLASETWSVKNVTAIPSSGHCRQGLRPNRRNGSDIASAEDSRTTPSKASVHTPDVQVPIMLDPSNRGQDSGEQRSDIQPLPSTPLPQKDERVVQPPTTEDHTSHECNSAASPSMFHCDDSLRGAEPMDQDTAGHAASLRLQSQSPRVVPRVSDGSRVASFAGGSTGKPSSMCASVQEPFYLRAETLRYAIEEGYILHCPITVEEIMDKSKSDTTARCVAALQIVYYLVQIVVRASQGLTVTPLEVAVASFVGSSVALYGLSLKKPKSVGVPTTISDLNGDETKILDRLRSCHGEHAWITLVSKYQEGDVPPNDILFGGAQTATGGTGNLWMLALFTVSGIYLGAVHLAGWHLVFPSNVDQWLWRAAALAMVSLFQVTPWSIAVEMAWTRARKANADLSWAYLDHTSNVSLILVGGLYYVARAVLLVEMWRCLFYLPPDAYIATSMNSFPHIG